MTMTSKNAIFGLVGLAAICLGAAAVGQYVPRSPEVPQFISDPQCFVAQHEFYVVKDGTPVGAIVSFRGRAESEDVPTFPYMLVCFNEPAQASQPQGD